VVNEFQNIWSKAISIQFEVIFYHLPSGTEENQETPELRLPDILVDI